MRRLIMPVALAAGLATAGLAAMAIAKTFTLKVATNATVTNQQGMTTHESIVVALGHGRAVYLLTGDSKSHPECVQSNHCFEFWPPVTVSSPSKLTKQPGIKGKLGIWHRDGFDQVMLAGHPLYFYAGDSKAHDATGQGIVSFGGTWFVIKPSPASGGTTTTASTGTTTTTTTSTTPTYTDPTTPTSPTTPTTPTPPSCTPPYCY